MASDKINNMKSTATTSSAPHYKAAGVDIDAGYALTKNIKKLSKKTHRPELLSSIGGFAALAEMPSKFKHPVIVTGTDGVGTKLKLLFDHNLHATSGHDLVAMCVNDILVCGAEPFLFLDYFATSSLNVEQATEVIRGITDACHLSSCSLVGGETAEMPGMYQPNEYDLAGFAIGVVEKTSIIDGKSISEGDHIIGLPSAGPHANGFSLIRKILEKHPLPEQLWDSLLAPTTIYVPYIQALLRNENITIHGMSHVTGGGLVENLPRLFPNESLCAYVQTDSWQTPPVFEHLKDSFNIPLIEMFRTFNMGIGFTLCVPPHSSDAVIDTLAQAGITGSLIGSIHHHNDSKQAEKNTLVIASNNEPILH